MANPQLYKMSGQRKRIIALEKEAVAWKKEYTQEPSENHKQKAKEVYNQLCDTLDACNRWLKGYEGAYTQIGNVERGPIQISWQKIP